MESQAQTVSNTLKIFLKLESNTKISFSFNIQVHTDKTGSSFLRWFDLETKAYPFQNYVCLSIIDKLTH